MADEQSVQLDQCQLLHDHLQNIRGVLVYLRKDGTMKDDDVLELAKNATNRGLKIGRLFWHISQRGVPAFESFINALVATDQLKLAKLLKPSLAIPTSSNQRESIDSDCKSPIVENKNTGKENVYSASSSSSVSRSDGRNGNTPDVKADISNVVVTSTIINVITCNGPPSYYDVDNCYRHVSSPKGMAMIINNQHFNGLVEDRRGSNVDCVKLIDLLQQLGYDVSIEMDLTKARVMEAMQKFADKADHHQCDSAFVVVLSHGLYDKFFGVDGEEVNMDECMSYLDGQPHHCPALINKPKTFLFQTCRGSWRDFGITVEEPGADDGYETDGYKRPTKADILIGYSTAPGCKSFRHPAMGSLFIEAICDVFAQHAHEYDVLHMLTMVNAIVVDKVTKRKGKEYKQVSQSSSSLTKKFYLLPGYYEMKVESS